MDFPLSRDRAARLIALAAVATTNDELVSLAVAEELPEFTVVVTLNQTAGKGRLGRTWDAPPGTSLAASVLLHPQHHHLPKDRYGWIPLASGFAMSSALSRFVPKHSVSLKWPNDVLIDGRKVSGVLSELLPDAASVVVGAGVNLTIPAESLPVPTATSLLLHGAVLPAEELADLVLAGYLDDLRHI
ncbi:MAG: biotin--[acetyl-CoA-carboxylase] ligase, partial [Terrimesophilobacter sp.]